MAGKLTDIGFQAHALWINRGLAAIGGQGLFGSAGFFENRSQKRPCLKMALLDLQDFRDIGKGGAGLAKGIEGLGTLNAGLGEGRVVIQSRREMLGGSKGIAVVQRIGATPVKQIDGRGTGLFPKHHDLGLDPRGLSGIGAFQPLEKRVDLRLILRERGTGKHQQQKCRNDTIVKPESRSHIAHGSGSSGNCQPLDGHEREKTMSDIIEKAVEKLSARLGDGFDGVAKFVIEDEGGIMIDHSGVRAGDEEADVTLTASAETFQAILEGDLNATAAFMAGKLKVDGSMGQAMKLGAALG